MCLSVFISVQLVRLGSVSVKSVTSFWRLTKPSPPAGCHCITAGEDCATTWCSASQTSNIYSIYVCFMCSTEIMFSSVAVFRLFGEAESVADVSVACSKCVSIAPPRTLLFSINQLFDLRQAENPLFAFTFSTSMTLLWCFLCFYWQMSKKSHA